MFRMFVTELLGEHARLQRDHIANTAEARCGLLKLCFDRNYDMHVRGKGRGVCVCVWGGGNLPV